MIVPGSASQTLAAALSSELDRPLAPVEFERFPDGELLAAAPEVETDSAVIVASTVTSDAHLELLQLQDALRESGVSEITTVLPYMGYARQDRAFETGQPVSVRAVARAVSTATDRVLTVSPHEESVVEHFSVPAKALEGATVLADPLPELADPVFLSPDAGAIDLAERVRDSYGGGEVDHFEKIRHSGDEVEITPSDVGVERRDVVIVDDIIATGSTMSEAISALERPERVFVTCVHPMLAGNARTKLARAGVERVYGTDTIERAESAVSVAPVIADALR
ncbi:MAG: ribose-phosphate diphosphokinase [Halalkalicoccus sp.]